MLIGLALWIPLSHRVVVDAAPVTRRTKHGTLGEEDVAESGGLRLREAASEKADQLGSKGHLMNW